MSEILKQLKKWIILSLNEILQIREAVNIEHKNSSSKERAEIFAQKIHEIMDSHLDGISDYERAEIRKQLIGRILDLGQESITRYDVFETIFELDLPQENQIELAKRWLKESSQIIVRSDEISSFLEFYDKVPVKHKRNMPYKVIFPILFAITAIALVIFSLMSPPDPVVHLDPPITIVYENRLITDGFFEIAKIETYQLKEALTLTIRHEHVIHLNDFPFPYKEFDYFKLKSYIIQERNGYLGISDHFNTIIYLSRKNNIDPLLLFSIAGHEQSFVPLDHALKDLMINNPYNVYETWETYNTTLEDSTQIAINTIKNRLKNLPSDSDPFLWLNETYAEDPKWHEGVKSIYLKLDNIASVKSN